MHEVPLWSQVEMVGSVYYRTDTPPVASFWPQTGDFGTIARAYLKIVTFVSARRVSFEERSLHKVNEHRRTDRNAPAMNNPADKTHFEIGSTLLDCKYRAVFNFCRDPFIPMPGMENIQHIFCRLKSHHLISEMPNAEL
jgi:hypothetical protein